MKVKTKKKDRATKVDVVCPFCGTKTEYVFGQANTLLNTATSERLYPLLSDEIRLALSKRKEFHFTDTCHNCYGTFEIEIRGD